MDTDFTIGPTEDRRQVRLAIAGDGNEEYGLEMTPAQAREIAFAIMTAADEIDPPAWRET